VQKIEVKMGYWGASMRLRQQHFGIDMARPLKQQQLYSSMAGCENKVEDGNISTREVTCP
jgi:hypothetical protein